MEERFYRNWVKAGDLEVFEVKEQESDLLVSADKDLSKEAQQSLIQCRSQLQEYILKNPNFKDSLEPLEVDTNAPEIVRIMAEASQKANVGPMAAVAGATAELVGKDLLKSTSQVIVENGGDIFISSNIKRKIGVFAGKSGITGQLNIEIAPEATPLGICTSSGTVGHSLSFGKADAVIAVSKSTALADAAATACCNLVKQEDDIQKALDFTANIKGITGILVVINDKIGIWGNFQMRSKGEFIITEDRK